MTRMLRVLAATLGALAVVLWGSAMFMVTRIPQEDALEGAIWGTAMLSSAIIGSVIAVRVPRHIVGWLLLIGGLGETLAGASSMYGDLAAAGRDLPLQDAVSGIGGSLWAFSAAALLVFLPLYFATGRPPSARWRWVGWLGATAVALLLSTTVDIAIFRPELMGLGWEAVEAAAGDRLTFVLSEHAFELLLGAAPLALLSLVVRFIRSRGEERQQIKLLVYAVAVTVAFIGATNLIELPRLVQALGTAIALPSIAVATMVAVLRYRLFDIDRVISRTLTYTATTAVLVGVYLGAVTALTTLTAPVTGDSAVTVAAATLASAAAFQPARRRIQSAVDRRFNRAAYDGRRTLQAFAGHLRQDVDLDDVRRHLSQTVQQVLQPATVVLWMRETP